MLPIPEEVAGSMHSGLASSGMAGTSSEMGKGMGDDTGEDIGG